MGRTWLVRGTAVAVFAVLVGAWAVGVAGLRDPGPSSEERRPASPEPSVAPEHERPIVSEETRSPRARPTDGPRDAVRKPRPDNDDAPATEDPRTPPPSTPDRTPDPPAPTEDPPDSPRPPGPSGTPSPDDDCGGLAGTVDCLLDPITGPP